MSDHAHTHDHDHGAEHHITPVSTYLGIFVALLVLLVVTVGAAYINLGSPLINLAFAMVIATIKAVLIVLYFMHVKWGSRLIWVFAAGGFLMLFVLFGITFGDYLTRTGVPSMF